MDKNLEIFCITDKHYNFFNDIKYKLAAVGKNNFPSNYVTCNTGENIFYKEEYYSELTEIVRGYIERELKVPALENTTDEVLAMIKDFKNADSIETSKETIKKLKDLLQEADLVKFAKSKPLAIEIEEMQNLL